VIAVVCCFHRSPALPPSCFRGACYLEKLDVLRENGHRTVGLRLHIFYEGSYCYSMEFLCCFSVFVWFCMYMKISSVSLYVANNSTIYCWQYHSALRIVPLLSVNLLIRFSVLSARLINRFCWIFLHIFISLHQHLAGDGFGRNMTIFT